MYMISPSDTRNFIKMYVAGNVQFTDTIFDGYYFGGGVISNYWVYRKYKDALDGQVFIEDLDNPQQLTNRRDCKSYSGYETATCIQVTLTDSQFLNYNKYKFRRNVEIGGEKTALKYYATIEAFTLSLFSSTVMVIIENTTFAKAITASYFGPTENMDSAKILTCEQPFSPAGANDLKDTSFTKASPLSHYDNDYFMRESHRSGSHIMLMSYKGRYEMSNSFCTDNISYNSPCILVYEFSLSQGLKMFDESVFVPVKAD